jgi:serine/threonine protein phosphatase PrpC
VIGTSHVATETRCQDHCGYTIVERAGGDALVIAVADGAGTATASFHGAKTAVEAALAHLTEALADSVLLGDGDAAADELDTRDALGSGTIAECFVAARERVLAMAADYEHDAREYASTLLVVVATPDVTLAGQIGDGAIVVDDGTLRAATWPQQGEYANATHFLVQDDALERLVTAELGAAQRIAVFSDGLQSLALQYESRSPYEPFFVPFFAYLESAAKPDAEVEDELRAYLDSASVNARTDDDKSLVLAVRR